MIILSAFILGLAAVPTHCNSEMVMKKVYPEHGLLGYDWEGIFTSECACETNCTVNTLCTAFSARVEDNGTYCTFSSNEITKLLIKPTENVDTYCKVDCTVAPVTESRNNCSSTDGLLNIGLLSEEFEYANGLGCVKFIEQKKNWREAREICKKLNADLVFTLDFTSSDSLPAYANSNKDAPGKFWVGLMNEKGESRDSFKSTTGQTVSIDAGIWTNSQPKLQHDNNCAFSYKSDDYFLSDDDCNASLEFLCGKPPS